MADSGLERNFLLACQSLNLPEAEREYMFHPKRRWRADFAWPYQRVLVEVEGGEWCRGRHVRGNGYNRDVEKYNAATLTGWRVLRFTGSMIESDPFGCARLVAELLEQG